MINTLKELWPQLPDKEKRDIANFVAKQMQPKTTDTARELLQELNDLLGTRYRPVTANLSLIQARLAEGNTREDISAVIARMCHMWANDPKMSQYLRPKTLFNAMNFNNYVGQIGMKLPEKDKPKLKRPVNDQEWMLLAKQAGAGKLDTYEQIWQKAVSAYDAGRLADLKTY